MSVAYSYTLQGREVAHEEHPNRWGFFDEAIQPGILQKLEAKGFIVDPYDGAEFRGSDLEALLVALKDVRLEFEAAPDLLGFDDKWIAFYESYRTSTDTPKTSAIRSITKLIDFTTHARLEGERLFFLGD